MCWARCVSEGGDQRASHRHRRQDDAGEQRPRRQGRACALGVLRRLAERSRTRGLARQGSGNSRCAEAPGAARLEGQDRHRGRDLLPEIDRRRRSSNAAATMSFRSKTIRRRCGRISKRLSTSRFFPLCSWDSGVEKAHGRIERRVIDVLPAEAAGIEREWPTVRQICRVMTLAPSQKERRVADRRNMRSSISSPACQPPPRHRAFAAHQSRSLGHRDHASKQRRHPRRGRLHQPLRQCASKHFLPYRLRPQNPEIRLALTNPRHRAISGRQKPRNPPVLRLTLPPFFLNRPEGRYVNASHRKPSYFRHAAGACQIVDAMVCGFPSWRKVSARCVLHVT